MGSVAEFEGLVSPLLDALYYTALDITRNAADAEDMVQEACMKGLKAFKSFTPGTDFKAWIFRILVNTTLDHIRKRHREAHVNSEELSLVSPKGKDPISIATVMDLEDAFAQLPRDYRAVLTLVDIYGFTHKEAAEMLQCPIGTINSRLVRGRMMLRSKL